MPRMSQTSYVWFIPGRECSAWEIPVQQHRGSANFDHSWTRVEAALRGLEHKLYQSMPNSRTYVGCSLYQAGSSIKLSFDPRHSLSMIFSLQVVPSVAFGFTAYDVIKSWLHFSSQGWLVRYPCNPLQTAGRQCLTRYVLSRKERTFIEEFPKRPVILNNFQRILIFHRST